MIKRIFHPIGQGAFYSERHENFNVVFDCGNWKKTKQSEMLVKQSFKKEDVIDILFISHFDSDHVNRIEVLKNHCANIKMVILPLLAPEEILLLTNFYKNIDNSIVPLITEPNQFFGKKTKIIYVKPSENDEIKDDSLLEQETLKNNQFIESGTKISNGFDWIFVPYNYEYKTRNQELLELLKKHSIDVSKLKKDLSYSVKNRAKLRLIYNKLSGKINQNSMFLYSGPLEQDKTNLSIQRHLKPFCPIPFPFSILTEYNNRVSCVYTGDGDLNKVRINIVYRKYWDLVGTIQIPHHGDIKTYKSTDISDKNYFCPISVGLNNTYGHPSTTVIADLKGNGNIPIQVTEDVNDLYFEIIK